MGTSAHDDRLLHGSVSHEILGAFFDVHRALGHGFLESVYRKAMFQELGRRGLAVAAEVPFSVKFQGEVVGDYRADLVVESKVIVECKTTDRLLAVHEAQLINYLRASSIELGLLLNFGPRASFRRLVCSSPKKQL
ncbi:MAG: GxxExxY protein [Gemmatimonadetes bacterium]|nr:GxxExxY protein [Gemmatimonadota bacterium]